jgi:hypothetical protein
MSNIIVAASASGAGTMTVQAPVTSSNRVLTLADTDGTLTPLVLATAQTASGTSVNFTDIPSWVKRITVIFNGISLSGTSNFVVQLGTVGGVDTSSYLGACNTFNTSPSATNYSSGFLLTEDTAGATWAIHGLMTITNVSGNIWAESHSVGITGIAGVSVGGGTKTLSSILTQIRITSGNGTDTFDAGTINIMYE